MNKEAYEKQLNVFSQVEPVLTPLNMYLITTSCLCKYKESLRCGAAKTFKSTVEGYVSSIKDKIMF